MQILLRRNRTIEGRLVHLLELTRRHVVDFGAAERTNELLPFVEGERLQVAAGAHDMRRKEYQQILLLSVARVLCEQVSNDRDVRDERHALTPVVGLARKQTANHRSAMILHQHGGRGDFAITATTPRHSRAP